MAKAIANLAIQLTLDSIKFSSQLTAVSTTVSAVGGVLSSTLSPALSAVSTAGGMVIDTVTGIGKGLLDMGVSAVTATANFLELQTGMAGVLKVGMDFEHQMSRVSALTLAGGDAFASMQERARQLGRDTQFTATNAAESMSMLATAGFKPTEINTAVGDVLKLATVGQMELSESAEIAAGTLRGFNLQADQMAHVTDVLAMALTNSKTNMTELGQALKYVAPIAGIAGASLEEVTAAIMVLSDRNLTGSMAGTALRGIFMKSANRTDEAKRSMEELGMSFEDVATGKLKPVADIIDEMNSKLGKFGEAKQLEILGNIFEMRAGTGAAALLASIRQSGNALRDRQKMLENSAGSADKMVATMMDNVTGAVQITRSAFEGLQEAIFATFSVDLKAGVRLIGDVFGALRAGVGGASRDLAGATAGLRPIADAARNTFNEIVFHSQGMWQQVWDAGVASAKTASDAVAASWQSLSGQLPTLQQFKVEFAANNMDAVWTGLTLAAELAWATIVDEARFTLTDRMPKLAAVGGDLAGTAFGEAFILAITKLQPRMAEIQNEMVLNFLKHKAGQYQQMAPNFVGEALDQWFGVNLAAPAQQSPFEMMFGAAPMSEARQNAISEVDKLFAEIDARFGRFRERQRADPGMFSFLGNQMMGTAGMNVSAMAEAMRPGTLGSMSGLINSIIAQQQSSVNDVVRQINNPSPQVEDKRASAMQQGSREAIEAEMRFFAGQNMKPIKAQEETAKNTKKTVDLLEQVKDTIRQGVKGTPVLPFIKK
jgi:TP901 family phage tail tape measure protein